jgi:hypothetical protein
MINIKAKLLEKISSDLEQKGFNLIKSRDWFVRKAEKRIDYFWIVFNSDEKYGYRVIPSLAIRINQVEDIFHLSSSFEKKYQKYTHTVITEIWRYMNDESNYQYKLVSEEDIEIVGQKLICDFENEALSFFDKYSSLRDLDILLNDYPNEENVYQIMDYMRCSHGAILARLCCRKNYTELISIYRNRMRNQDKGYYLSRFEKLIEILNIYPNS